MARDPKAVDDKLDELAERVDSILLYLDALHEVNTSGDQTKLKAARVQIDADKLSGKWGQKGK